MASKVTKVPLTESEAVALDAQPSDPMDLAVLLAAVDDRARAQGTSLIGILEWAAHAGHGISILPLPVEEDDA